MKFSLSLRSPQPIIILINIFSLVALFLFATVLHGQNVDFDEASAIAEKFFNNLSPQSAAISNSFSESIEGLAGTEIATLKNNVEEPLFHIFNFEGGGFVIVAADMQYEPIIGYNSTGSISEEKINQNLWGFLEGHKIQMLLLKEGSIQLSETEKTVATEKWKAAKKGEQLNNLKIDEVVSPLTTTAWGQEEFFNAYCPEDDYAAPTNDGHVYTGCVTVAMAQIMKYHNHPYQGNGSKSYEDYPYGVLTADYGNTIYNWNNMPDGLSTYNNDVAQLMYHAATSISTEFSPTYTAGYTSRVDEALIYHFNYDNEAQFIIRNSHSGQPWNDIVVSELNLNRPVLMTGYQGTGASHAWVIDGYSTDNYYHVNWGWEGLANGWFYDNGTIWEVHGEDNDPNYPYDISFYDNQFMVYKIYPAQGCVDIRLQDISYGSITENAAEIYTTQFQGPVSLEWRYRRAGTNESWISMPITQYSNVFLNNLFEGTEYEIQVRQQCGDGSWSPFSASYNFDTPGTACVAVNTGNVFTTSYTETSMIAYTILPFGSDYPLQFRYRPAGTNDAWMETEVTFSYFLNITNLAPGTTYEFQVRHQCSSGEWTAYSGAIQGSTTGEQTANGCPAPGASDVSSTVYYAYFPSTTAYDWVQTQFRWRPSGGGAWNEGPALPRYYRRIKGMGITYGQSVEMQIRLNCSNGEWSEYSPSYFFTSEDNL